MTLPYTLRMVSLCLAAFFVMNALAGLALRLLAERLVKVAERMEARNGAWLLLTARLIPAALGGLVLMVCIPSYLWLEPEAKGERVRMEVMAAACCGLLGLGHSVWRAGLAMWRSARYRRECERRCERMRLGSAGEVLIADSATPLLGLAGLARPRVVMSRTVLNALRGRELAAALRHEAVHRDARDNWKRLLVLAAPEPVPFARMMEGLERGWSRLAEWAADEAACAGNARRGVALASALVRVAGLGRGARPAPVLSSLIGCSDDLGVRVEKLLAVKAGRVNQGRSARLAAGLAAAVAGAAGLMAPHGEVMQAAHRILEAFTH